jgi:hypothetical protein
MDMASGIPLASHEVRWFFEGRAEDHPELKRWFETTEPVEKDAAVGAPLWKSRDDDQPDVYLRIPGSEDLGIKWREGELQIKGRTAMLGTQVFGRLHQGRVERWVKWSYTKMPDEFRALFAEGPRLPIVSVRKVRALRKLRLDTMLGTAQEVDAKTFVDRGLGCELTNLEVSGKTFCSLAFEAFPDDAAMHEAFACTVSAFLDGLQNVELGAAKSMSYPIWLGQLHI